MRTSLRDSDTRVGSYDIWIGGNSKSSLAVKVTYSPSCANSAKSRKSAELKGSVNPGFTTGRGNFLSTEALIYIEI
ncbi:hypothetical protein M5K25_020857 [Dendrobium thyrsiflorum]|uniref:Uncharacterized protein n=1 Tax=Dendrobium thyrsiflorum TaxID=117978 RepID=A0ABD0UAZ5_DENTH